MKLARKVRERRVTLEEVGMQSVQSWKYLSHKASLLNRKYPIFCGYLWNYDYIRNNAPSCLSTQFQSSRKALKLHWIHPFFWCNMIWAIVDHWSWFKSSQRNAPIISVPACVLRRYFKVLIQEMDIRADAGFVKALMGFFSSDAIDWSQEVTTTNRKLF